MKNFDDTKTSDRALKRRSLFAMITGLIVIGFCLLWVTAVIAPFFFPCGPSLGSVVGAPFVPPFIWLAYKQYSALFCREPVVSRAYHEVWIGFGIFLVVSTVGSLLQHNTEIMKDTDAWKYQVGIPTCGLLFLVIGCLIRIQTIRRQKPFLPEGRKFLKNQSGSKFRHRKIMGIILMTGCVTLLSAYLVSTERQYPALGEHFSYEQLPRKGGFPPEGSDFSWRRGYRGTSYYEFTISEEAFQRWISSQSRWEYCEPITGNVTIQGSIHPRKEEEESPSVTDGLSAGYGEHSGGCAVFDRSTNRAYYWTYY